MGGGIGGSCPTSSKFPLLHLQSHPPPTPWPPPRCTPALPQPRPGFLGVRGAGLHLGLQETHPFRIEAPYQARGHETTAAGRGASGSGSACPRGPRARAALWIAKQVASPKLPRLTHRRRPLSPPGCSLGSRTLGLAGSAPGAEQGTEWVGVGAGQDERRGEGFGAGRAVGQGRSRPGEEPDAGRA